MTITSLLTGSLAEVFQSHAVLLFENMALRHQILVLQRKQKKRVQFTSWDRILWILFYRWWPKALDALVIVKPATVIKWHRQGFRMFWRWKSEKKKKKPGHPPVSKEIQGLIRRMCQENPLWGAPRIHGELLKLGYEVAQSSVSRYMIKPQKPPSQTWKTFLENHADQIIAMDFLTVPTVFFNVLHVLILINHKTRKIVYFNITTNPTAAWVAQQLKEAFPWDSAPRYLLHDRDPVFWGKCKATIKAIGIENVQTAPQSPWQNPYCERALGSMRRELLDHIIVLNEDHLRRAVSDYLVYYHGARTHLSLDKDCPEQRPVQAIGDGNIVAFPHIGGLHHQYLRQVA